VDEAAAELYFSYLFIVNSSSANAKLKLALQEDFAKGQNQFPRNRQQSLHLFDKLHKTTKLKEIISEGSSLPQLVNSRRAARNTSYFGKTRLVTPVKKCHQASEHKPEEIACSKKETAKAESRDKSDECSKKSSKSSSSSRSSSSFKMALGKAFSILGEQLESLLEENSDLSGSDEEQSNFMISSELTGVVKVPPATKHVTLAHIIKQGLEQCFAVATKVCKKFHGLELPLCVAFDNQSSCDIFNNRKFCTDFRKAPHSIKISSTGGQPEGEPTSQSGHWPLTS